jgi:hypothetical protein
MSQDQNAGQSYNIKTDNSSFERVEVFRYMGTTLTNQNYIQEEIKSRLKSWSACYQSVQNLLPYSLLSKTIQINVYKTIIFLVFCIGVKYGCSHGVECRLRVFEIRVLRRIFWPKRDEVAGEWRKLHSR